MTEISPSFWLGLFGFVVFESFRIYRRTTVGKAALPRDTFGRVLHLLVLLVLGISAGLMATVWSANDPIRACYLGLTLPATLSAIIGKSTSSSAAPAGNVDDLRTRRLSRLDAVTAIIRDAL